MRTSQRFWPLCGLFLALLGGFSTAARADYNLVAEPVYPPEKAKEVYKPLVEYLNKATGEKFALVTPRNYHFYWRDMKQTEGVDFAIDEPHLADYRLQRYQFVPVVRSAEPTSYTLAVDSQHPAAGKGPESLVGKKIVSFPAPSLGYAVLLSMYPNPIAQPDIESNATTWKDATDTVFAGEADALILPTRLMNTFPNLTAIKASKQFPGTLISANPKVPEAVRQKVKEAMLKLDADPNAATLLFELGFTKFVEANAAEYAGSEQQLKDFFGYQ